MAIFVVSKDDNDVAQDENLNQIYLLVHQECHFPLLFVMSPPFHLLIICSFGNCTDNNAKANNDDMIE